MKKIKGDDSVQHEHFVSTVPTSLKLRRRIVLFVCPVFSLLLVMGTIHDAMPRHPSGAVERQRLERTLEGMEELGAELARGTAWPQSDTYGKVPCTINVSGYTCPNLYGAMLNNLYLLEKTLDANRSPAYRSLEGYCGAFATPLLRAPHLAYHQSPTRWSDQSANAPHGTDIETNIFSTCKLPSETSRGRTFRVARLEIPTWAVVASPWSQLSNATAPQRTFLTDRWRTYRRDLIDLLIFLACRRALLTVGRPSKGFDTIKLPLSAP